MRKYDDHKPCPKCKKSSEQVVLPPERSSVRFQPIVVHVDAEGNYRFPGSPDARIPRGFQKVELTTIPEIEAMERKVNVKLRGDAERHIENEERVLGAIKAKLRGELQQRMATMSPLGRAFAEAAIARSNARRRKSSDVGFHVNILHYNQGNREGYSDERTGWRERKA